MDAFGRTIAVILAAILIILYPLQYLAINQGEVLESHVQSETSEFADEIMLQGYLDLDMYSNYLDKLAATSKLYDIELIHSKPTDGYNTGSISSDNTEKKLLQTSSNTTDIIENKVMEISFAKTTAANALQHNNHSHDTEGNCLDTGKNEEQEGFASLGLVSKSRKIVTLDNKGVDGTVQLMAAHVHTADCYAGHRHEESCTVKSGNMSTPVNITYFKSINTSWESGGYGYNILIQCAYCDRSLYFISYSDCESDNGNTTTIGTDNISVSYMTTLDDYYSTPTTKSTGINRYLYSSSWLEGYYYYNAGNGNSGYRKENPLWSNYLNEFLSLEIYIKNLTGYTNQGVTIKTWGVNYKLPFQPYLGCYYEGRGTAIACGYIQDENPLCSQVVIGITATNPIQTIDKGGNIITTATASYLDGHIGTVSCTNNFNSSQIGDQMVTLTYTGLVGTVKTTGTRTCTANITVKETNIPASITVTPSSTVVYNGTEPTYTVQLTYMNGTIKIITTGYTKTGFTTGAGTKTLNFTYTENGKTVSTNITVIVKRNLKVCEYGHAAYELDDYDTDNGCQVCKETIKSISVVPEYITVDKGNNLDISVTVTYYDGHTNKIISGWSSNFNSSQLGNQLVSVIYKDNLDYVSVTVVDKLICPICGTTYSVNTDGSDPGCPICSKNVVSITAKPETQILKVDESLSLEVIATYIDGHSEIITDWTSNFTPYKVGKQSVTIFYNTISTTVTIIVESETETTCPICGTVYNPVEYSNRCPICSKTVESIEARLRNEGTQVQYGSELNLTVILIYRDNHREIAYNGWIVEGYQSDVLGMQTLTITYKEYRTTLTIEVVNTLSSTICNNGHVYYLNADGSDPGCPYCNQDTTSESAKGYFDCIYTEDILNELYTKGIYYFEIGDYITVTVTPKSLTFLEKLQNMTFMTADNEKKYSYGGMICNGKYI